MRANASFTHPVFTHPKQKPEYYTKKTWASGSPYQCSNKGWITEEIILLWL
jgi:hypothetical protein